ncbi:MAG: hypothetical protein WCR01_01545 [Bacteroidota bacterium]
MEPNDNSLPLSSRLPDQETNDFTSSWDEEPSCDEPEDEKNDFAKTLNRFAELARMEGRVYRKLIEEVKMEKRKSEELMKKNENQ